MRTDSSSRETLFDKEIFVPLQISSWDNWFLYNGWFFISSSDTLVFFTLLFVLPAVVVGTVNCCDGDIPEFPLKVC